MGKRNKSLSPRFLRWLLSRLYGRKCVGFKYSGSNRIIGIKGAHIPDNTNIQLLIQSLSIIAQPYNIDNLTNWITMPCDTGKTFRLSIHLLRIDSEELKDILKNERQKEIF